MDGLNSPFTSCLSSIHGRTNKRGLRKSSSVESLTESFSAKRDSGQNSLLLNNSQWLAFIESMPFSLVPRSRSMSDSSLHKQGASSSADRNESNDSQGPTTSSNPCQPSCNHGLHQVAIKEEPNDCDNDTNSLRPISSPVSSSAYFTSSSRNSSTISLPYTHSRNSSTTSSGYGVLREEDLNFMTELPCTIQPVNSEPSTYDGVMPGSTSRQSLEMTMCDPTVVAISAISSTTGNLTPEQQKKLTGNNTSKESPGLSLVTLKSSEWIKKQLESFKDSMVQVKVSSKNKHVVHFNVKAGDVIVWKFATKKRDIAFGVLFESTAVETEQCASPTEPNHPADKMIPILPILRVPANTHPIQGSHVAVSDGLYVIAWDNSYSRIFAKDLFYCIYTESADGTSHFNTNSTDC